MQWGSNERFINDISLHYRSSNNNWMVLFIGGVMIEYLEFMFSGFWVFIGCFMVLTVPFRVITYIYNRTLRHWNIRKHGYPPEHCDADGDFKPPVEVETNKAEPREFWLCPIECGGADLDICVAGCRQRCEGAFKVREVL